jgi:hypothetical protein
VPRFEPAPCPKLQAAEELGRVSCGYNVPENRSRPTGRTIRLMVASYPAHAAEKRADPVVLAGGPGDIAPLEVNGLIAADIIRDRDMSYRMSEAQSDRFASTFCAADYPMRSFPILEFFRMCRWFFRLKDRAHHASRRQPPRRLPLVNLSPTFLCLPSQVPTL